MLLQQRDDGSISLYFLLILNDSLNKPVVLLEFCIARQAYHFWQRIEAA
jgi:hypothetical protein